jgi:hypothetical protein
MTRQRTCLSRLSRGRVRTSIFQEQLPEGLLACPARHDQFTMVAAAMGRWKAGLPLQPKTRTLHEHLSAIEKRTGSAATALPTSYGRQPTPNSTILMYLCAFTGSDQRCTPHPALFMTT